MPQKRAVTNRILVNASAIKKNASAKFHKLHRL